MDHMTHYYHLSPEECAIIMLERDRAAPEHKAAVQQE